MDSLWETQVKYHASFKKDTEIIIEGFSDF